MAVEIRSLWFVWMSLFFFSSPKIKILMCCRCALSLSLSPSLSLSLARARISVRACMCCCCCCCWLLLYGAILRSRADSLRLHVILHEWLAFYSAFLNIHWSGVLTVLTCVCVCVHMRVWVISFYFVRDDNSWQWTRVWIVVRFALWKWRFRKVFYYYY